MPVSSSGHLILLPNLTGLDDQGLTIDVAVHVGMLVAVVLYFRAETMMAVRGGLKLVAGQTTSPEARLALGLVIATIPVVLAGLVLQLSGMSAALRSTAVVGWTTLIFGLVLYWADQTRGGTRESTDWSVKHAFIMGFWQILALIPGTSRSGITITAGLTLGYSRTEAARLAMLMSIPVILASGVLLGAEIAIGSEAAVWRDVAIAAGFACVAALIALTLMMRLLRSVSFTPYVIYRVALGLALLTYAYA